MKDHHTAFSAHGAEASAHKMTAPPATRAASTTLRRKRKSPVPKCTPSVPNVSPLIGWQAAEIRQGAAKSAAAEAGM